MSADRVVLVYGFYGKGNVGDELMKKALVRLFQPHGVTLSFTDHIGVPELTVLERGDTTYVDAVIFGGGSIMYADPLITPAAMALLLSKQIPVFYVGVGGETGPSPKHQQLLDVAQAAFFRELDMPDLAYSLVPDLQLPPAPADPKGLLFVPNVELVPTHADPHWMHVAWEHFKNEVAQVLDRCVDRKVPVSMLLMCNNDRQEDAWAAGEVISRMCHRGKAVHVYAAGGLETLSLMQHHQVVVTQRYHGIIMAEMAGVPYVTITHHDKLKFAHPHRGSQVSYHGVQKDALTDAIENACLGPTLPPFVPVMATYDRIVEQVIRATEEK